MVGPNIWILPLKCKLTKNHKMQAVVVIYSIKGEMAEF